MITAGIVCEYNPFHNGHRYQIEKTRQMGATHIVAVMSGNFVQRGDISILDKHKRAEIAVKSGADLVVELPVPYSIASAELFARGAVHILNSLGVVDRLSFGSECGEIEILKAAADASEKISDSVEFKKLISNGISYPAAIYTLLKRDFSDDISEVFSEPNNTLAVEYLKSLKSLKSEIEPCTIKRSSAAHDSKVHSNGFASASLLREKIISGESVEKFVPDTCSEIINSAKEVGFPSMKRLEKIIFYKLFSMSREELSAVPDGNNGLSDRLFKACRSADSLEELLSMTKTKCFTLARIRRIIAYSLLGISKRDFAILPPYCRILALNDRGCEILSASKKTSELPVSTSLSDLSKTGTTAKRFAELDCLATEIFSLALDSFGERKNEYRVNVKKVL